MSCNLPIGSSGLPFHKADKGIIWFCLTKSQIVQILCHGLSNHGVNQDGGFYGGENSETKGKGVAVGKNAKVLPSEPGKSINAIQLGEGTNTEDYTFRVLQWSLLDRYGIIPKDRLPELDFPEPRYETMERKAIVISQAIAVINPKHEKFLIDTTNNHVDLVLPEAKEVDGLGFYFRLYKQGIDGFAFKVERSHSDVIHIGKHADQGGYEEWIGITCDQVGTWFYITACNDDYYLVSESDITKLNNTV